MSDRIKNRLKEASKRGIGSAYTVNQKISMGLDEEEAERAAAEAAGVAAEESGEEVKEEEAEEVEEIPPPDQEDPSESEVRLAREVQNLLRRVPDSQGTKKEDDFDAEEVRKQIEDQLDPIDVSQAIFYGSVEQRIPLGSDDIRLDLVLKSLKVHHYALLDRWIYGLSTRMAMPLRHKLRYLTGAAVSTKSVGGKLVEPKTWPDQERNVTDPELSEWADFFEKRLNWLLNLPPTIVEAIAQNVTWFEQRVDRVLRNVLYMRQEVKK